MVNTDLNKKDNPPLIGRAFYIVRIIFYFFIVIYYKQERKFKNSK
nr:MAG TPA: hypothetical protein [Caudoviricetes sp.]